MSHVNLYPPTITVWAATEYDQKVNLTRDVCLSEEVARARAVDYSNGGTCAGTLWRIEINDEFDPSVTETAWYSEGDELKRGQQWW